MRSLCVLDAGVCASCKTCVQRQALRCKILDVDALQLASFETATALMNDMRNTGERNREAQPVRPAAAAHVNVFMRVRLSD